MTVPLDVEGGAIEAQPEAVLAGVGKQIEGRSLGQIAWIRLKRDKLAIASGVLVVLLIVLAIVAPLLVKLFGFPPTEFHQDLVDPTFSVPKGSFGGISTHHWLGVEPETGRDIFSRIVMGSRPTMIVAFGATLLQVVFGVVLGITSGYFGGAVDASISRLMDIFLAFPLLLFALALAAVIPDGAFGMGTNTLHIVVMIFIIGFFSWPYVGRIIRGQTLSLREREFVDAARSLGAGPRYILFKELLPNLVAPILVYSSLVIPTNILFEAALSFLGVGVQPPNPSWGQMLSDAVDHYTNDPMFMIVPGAAIFLTVLAFNLFGDGLRDALDPRSSR